MESQILKDVGLLERKILIRDSAIKTEKFTYPKSLSNDEVIGLKDQFTKNAITLAKHDESKKEFMEKWKSDVKPIKSEMGFQMSMIRSKVEEITEDVYLLPEYDEGMMGYYNASGALVYQRPLMPDEKQLSIVGNGDILKNGTDK